MMRRIETAKPCSSSISHVDDVDAAIPQQPPFAQINRPDAEQVQPTGLDQPMRLVAEHPLEPGSPHSMASDMPCMLPDGELSGVLKSEWASSQRTNSSRPASVACRATPPIEPMARL